MLKTGLIGRSILSSRSPWLHEQEAAAQGMELTYELFDFTQRGLPDEALPDFLRGLAGEGYAGVNITFPFKQQVIPALDTLSDGARMVGAVNTVAIRDGRMSGHNTDMEGFLDSLRAGLPGAPLGHVLLLGAGGAGAAVASALLAAGVGRLSICDVDPARATALAARLSAAAPGRRVRAVERSALSTADVDGIVNATPIGMAAHPGTPIDARLITPRHWVADIIYFPLETELLRDARAKGCATLDGIGMVVGQAALAFEIITGMPADRERMKRTF